MNNFWILVVGCVWWVIWVTWRLWELHKEDNETNAVIVSLMDDIREIQGLPTIRGFKKGK